MDVHCFMNVCLSGSEGVGKSGFTVIMLTSSVHVCVCLHAVSFQDVFLSFCQFVHVSNVYKTLGVCSCVYSACPEIVTELRKQFTVNKPFPCSNKGPMRLNSVPASQPPRVMKNKIPSQPKHSVGLLYFSAFAASAGSPPSQ